MAVTAGTTYVVAVYNPDGRYSVTSAFFVNQYVNSPLTGQLGVYAYGSDAFPVNTYGGSNYFVDVLFSPPVAAAPVVVSKSPSGSPAQLNTSVTATFDQAVTSSSLAFTLSGPGGSVPGTVSYNAASFTATFQPGAALAYGTTYTASVSATSTGGLAMASPTVWTFSTVSAPPTGTANSLFADTDLPDTAAWNDPGPVTVGIKFSSTVAGTVTAVKFYAGPGNTGPQPVALVYRVRATKLGGGTATGTASGWTTVHLDTSGDHCGCDIHGGLHCAERALRRHTGRFFIRTRSRSVDIFRPPVLSTLTRPECPDRRVRPTTASTWWS